MSGFGHGIRTPSGTLAKQSRKTALGSEQGQGLPTQVFVAGFALHCGGHDIRFAVAFTVAEAVFMLSSHARVLEQ
jgi:hypothetical protein